MPRFRATIKGQSNRTARVGTKASGMTADIRGLNWGVEVTVKNENDVDVFEVWINGGKYGGSIACVGTFKNGVWIAEYDKVT